MCLDETSKQLIVETRAPIPAKPGQPARHDYEYERNGVANLFMMFAPLEGWRHVKVTDHHAAVDYAQANGARALEGYAMLTQPGKEITWGELHVGARQVFAEAGFTEVSRPSVRRAVMRIDFGVDASPENL